jgi:cytochrome P450
MANVTADIVTRALFGIGIKRDGDAVAEAVTEVNRRLMQGGLTLRGAIAALTGRPTREVRRPLATLDGLVSEIITARRRSSEGHDDLLSLLLAARDEETGEGMSDLQLRDEVLTLFAAGHETTANALAWTWYLLSLDRTVAERLRGELAGVLGGRAASIEDLPRLVYTRMVIDEAMRLFPPAWATSRNAVEEDELGGVRIPKGAIVLMSPYVTHRRPDLWDQPKRFDPDRFAPERAGSRPRYAYFPFGGGPRLCIGSSFALTEATLVLAALAQRFELRLPEGHQVEPEPMVTLRPRGGLPMRVERV